MPTLIGQFVLLFWTLLALFLVALFWSLYRQLGRKRSFLFWTWAWIAYALYYGINLVQQLVPAGQSAINSGLVLVEMLAVYGRAPLLFFGARCFAREDRREPRLYRIGMTVTLAAGVLIGILSLSVEPEATARWLRNLPRAVLAGAALLYAGVVFARRWRAARSWAALVTGIAAAMGGIINLAFVVVRPLRVSLEAWAYWSGLEWLSSLGIALGMIYVLTDEYRSAQLLLRETDARFRLLIENSSDAIVVIGADARVIYRSPREQRMLGYGQGDDVSRGFLEWVHPDDRERAARFFAACLVVRGYAPPIELRVRKKDGTWLPVEVVANNLIHDPALRGIVTSMRDVSERRRADAERRAADERYRALVETMSEGLMVADLQERVEFVNDRCCAMLGYARDELIGMTTYDLVATAGDAERLRPKPALRREGVADRYELAFHTQAGQTIWTQVSGAPMRDTEGRVVGTIGVITDITERKQAEDERDKVFLLSLDLLATVSVDGQFTRVNPAFERTLGYVPEDLLGRSFLDLVHPEDLAATEEQVRRLQQGRPIIAFENRCRRKDGTWRWLSWNCAPPETGVVYVVARDVTDRRSADEAIARQRAFLREVIDVTPCFIFLKDRDGRYVLMNRMHAELYGARPEDLEGKVDAEIHTNAADVKAFNRADLTVLETGRDLVLQELATMGPDGRKRWAKVIKRRMTDANGEALVLGVAMDISDRKEAELRQAAVYRIAQAADRAEGLDDLFRSVHEIIREVMSGRNFFIALHDADSGLVTFPYWVDDRDPAPEPRINGRGLTEYVLRTGKPLLAGADFDRRMTGSDEVSWHGTDSKVWLGVPLIAGDRRLGVMAVQDYDASDAYGDRELQVLEFVSSQIAKAIERTRVEEARERLQADVSRAAMEWRRTFDAIASPILILDLDGRIVRLNEAARVLARRHYESVLGTLVGEAGRGEPWKRIAELALFVRTAHAGSASEVRDEATGRTWDVSASPLAVEEDGSERIIVVARDITRLERLQTSLRRSETMSAMGSLVAGVAHEVRNPLFSMTATLDAFEARYGVRKEYQKHLAVLRGQLGRLTELMQELLDYGRPSLLALSSSAIGDVIGQAMETCLESAKKAKVKVVRQVRPDLPVFPVDRLRLVQVFLNLLENAIQHTPPGRSITVDAEVLTVGDQRWVECVVADDGPGFNREDIPNLFEPFFTRRRGGTGLGLSLVQRIVEQHGGRVIAENRPVGGAVIRVRLPVPQGGAAPVSVAT